MPASKKNSRVSFGANVRRERLKRGLSQEALAEMAGLHRTYVGAVERGERNVSIDAMTAFAHAFGLRLSELTADVARKTKPHA